MLSCLAASPAAAQANLISNGGFEQVDGAGRPADWAILGAGRVVDGGRNGTRAVLIEGRAEGESGLNRSGGGRPGALPGRLLAPLKGAVRFWYRADAVPRTGSVVFHVIAIGETGIENTGERRASFEIPATGDSAWRQGVVAYDFTGNPKVRHVQVAPRANGPGARAAFDDIEWAAAAGPVPNVGWLRIEEAAGGDCVVSAGLWNAGDRAIDGAKLRLDAPSGLGIEGGPERKSGRIPPDGVERIAWRIKGRRAEAGRLRIDAEAAGIEAAGTIEYGPRFEAASLLAEPGIVAPEGRSRLMLRLHNHGHAEARDIRAEFSADAPLQTNPARAVQTLDSLAPGAEGLLVWEVKAGAETPQVRARVRVGARGAEPVELAASMVVAPPAPAEAEAKAGAGVSADLAWIGNARVRILFPKAASGFGPGWLQRAAGGGWQTVGALPRLTRLVTPGKGGKPEEHFLFASAAREIPPGGKGAAIELSARLRDGGGIEWTVTETLSAAPGGEDIGVAVKAAPSAAASLLALDGPVLCAGEGAPAGTRRLDAIFCGAEWLVEGEASSSDLDIAPDHEHRMRRAPHPHMVTIPVMSARLAPPEGRPAVVWMAWDHLAPYIDGHNRPTPLFASPDRFEGRASTTMGIFAPSMPEFIEPNQRVAHAPMPVAAGGAVALSARIGVIDGGEGVTALDAVMRWCSSHPLPEPHALPHGKTIEDEIAFSMQAYLGPLWKADEEKWLPYLGGPATGNVPAWRPDYLYDLRMALELCPPSALMQRVRERHDRVIALGRIAPCAEDAGFHFAGPAERLGRLAAASLGTLEKQLPAGGWAFDARIETRGIFKGRDYAELGEDGALEVGTCARKARDLLAVARMTGEREARDGGLKALMFMDNFEVPRAAQVWEVPVHTPDILASAEACEAYIEGYLVTGDRRHLDRAVYWAWTGVPFVYLWDVPGFEYLRYASIPVFGATWFKGSWFARPVQWNGLRYAEALFRLAEHDKSLDWAKMARGLVVSAMYQQSIDEADVALWPDSINAIDKKKSRWVFSPQQVLANAYRMMGIEAAPVTVALPAGQDRIRITAAGRITGAELDARELRFTVAHKRLPSGHVIVANVTRPSEVLVDGAALAPWPKTGAEPAPDAAPGWRYIDGQGMVEIRLAGGERRVQVRGAAWSPDSPVPSVASDVAFGFDNGAEGWTADHQLEPFAFENGTLSTATTGNDPYMTRRACRIPASAAKQLHIRMSVASGGPASGQFFWTTDEEPDFGESKVLRVPVTPDGQFHDSVVSLAGHPRWKGTVTAIRFDPVAGGSNVPVRIDFIRGE